MSGSRKRGFVDYEVDSSPSKKSKSDAPLPDIVGSFEAFSQGLSTLLSPLVTTEALTAALGVEKTNLLIALGAMKAGGDLSWLPEPQAPTSQSPSTGNNNKPWPPPLPTVRNPQLRQQAFTHPSFILGETAGAPGVENVHYERLEFLGDAYLQSISSHLLFSRFPTFREGHLSEMRQCLVSNKPLTHYARLYDMHRLVRQGKGQEFLTTQPKIVADCFEAYIGAVVLDADNIDDGVQNARQWLAALFEPKIQEMEMQRKKVAPVDKMAKQSLNAIAGGNKAKIDYRWTDGGGGNKGGFWVSVYLNGWGFTERMLGKGWGSSKSDAELRAAMNVIANEQFCKEIREVKEKILGPRPPRDARAKNDGSSASASPSTTKKARTS